MWNVHWWCFGLLDMPINVSRDVLENTVQAGTPAKVSKCDVELDIEVTYLYFCKIV